MFLNIIETLKEFLTWDSKTKIIFVGSLIVIGAGAIYVQNYIGLKEEISVIKADHQEEIKTINRANNELLNEQRRKFQEEIDSYAINYNKERDIVLKSLSDELSKTKNELYRLKQEIKKIKNEIVE